jgi:fucose permease
LAFGATLVFWIADPLAARVIALFAAGLGVSVLFPMILALAIGCAADRPDAAAARASIAGGGATLLAPVTLGWLADRAGIHVAFALVPILFLAASLLAGLASHWSDRDQVTVP